MEKGIRGEIFHAIPQYVKAKSKYIKEYDKNKEFIGMGNVTKVAHKCF